jgi:hypothetical protein
MTSVVAANMRVGCRYCPSPVFDVICGKLPFSRRSFATLRHRVRGRGRSGRSTTLVGSFRPRRPTLPRVARPGAPGVLPVGGQTAGTEPWPLRSSLELAALPTAVPNARLHARSILHEWRLEALADTVELLVSEIVTNAVRASAEHGATSETRAGHRRPHSQALAHIQRSPCSHPGVGPRSPCPRTGDSRISRRERTRTPPGGYPQQPMGLLHSRRPGRQNRLGHARSRRSRSILTADPPNEVDRICRN